MKRDALAIFKSALRASDAGNAVRCCWRQVHPYLDADRIFLVAAGKAASSMAAVVHKQLGKRLTAGVVVTKHGHSGRALPRLDVFEAGHPVPDVNGILAAQRVIALLRELNARDLLIVALSGGASALLPAPAPGITLQQKQRLTERLLRAGADITELNTVRKHLSTLKGGQLAALAYPAKVVSLILSDVIGDPLDVIASGPTVPDASSLADAKGVLAKYKIAEPRALHETAKAGEPFFRQVHNIVVGSNSLALTAAACEAQRLGYQPMILASTLTGEARELGRTHAAILRQAVKRSEPVCFLSGGEPTVTVRGTGKGGRAQEFALAAAMALDRVPHCLLLSAGTDGTDGPTDAAGAIVTGDTMKRARMRGLDAFAHLENNDAYKFFSALGDLVKTGPTGTNVMDINVMLTGAARHRT